MQLSARNQIEGTVKALLTDGLTAEVVVNIGGKELVSTITKGSAERLGLKIGDKVTVVIKASEVMIGK
jgi:molybdopterin-binding protein